MYLTLQCSACLPAYLHVFLALSLSSPLNPISLPHFCIVFLFAVQSCLVLIAKLSLGTDGIFVAHMYCMPVAALVAGGCWLLPGGAQGLQRKASLVDFLSGWLMPLFVRPPSRPEALLLPFPVLVNVTLHFTPVNLIIHRRTHIHRHAWTRAQTDIHARGMERSTVSSTQGGR